MAVLGLACFMAVPYLSAWEEEQTLDMAAAEVKAAILAAQTAARSGKEGYGSFVSFYCNTSPAGRVEYYCRRGIRRFPPKGKLPSGVSLSAPVSMTFSKDGLSGTSQNTGLLLISRNRRYKRHIIVAVYTGRVRIETVK